jgi:hypothetical protein
VSLRRLPAGELFRHGSNLIDPDKAFLELSCRELALRLLYLSVFALSAFIRFDPWQKALRL